MSPALVLTGAAVFWAVVLCPVALIPLGLAVVCIVLAISAAYELVEWGAALALGQGADEFLGTQGDPWDTQADMFLALLGAGAALALLSRLDRKSVV